ncbi:globin family protein [uncultured Piscinibacter sp.]|uniref:globin family protein n=1 Tax=uncultured Piscinibacter sp. TaxID=1131835 RepID=UPI0026337711|nr:globin family protein [uncultured Piscinibacter sp.]
MTPQQTHLVRRSFELVAPMADEAAALFYRKLFAQAPELKPLFIGDLRSQGRRLMEMIGAAVRLLDHPPALLPVLAQLGARHAGYGVQPADYRSVGVALIATLEEGLGADFDAATREAWLAMYALVSTSMMAAAGQARRAA